MRIAVVFFAGCVLATARANADEFKNPRVVSIRAPGGELTIRAKRGTAVVPGLGEVEQVYGYDVRRGTASRRGGASGTNVALMPPLASCARGRSPRIPDPNGV